MALRSGLRPKAKDSAKNGSAIRTQQSPPTADLRAPEVEFDLPPDQTSEQPSNIVGGVTGGDISFQQRFSTAVVATLEPKAMVPFAQKRGRVPRRIEVERRRRLYESYDISQLIEVAGLNLEDIGRRDRQQLPLAVFDDTSYESRNPQEWMAIARAAEDPESRFLPSRGVRHVGELHPDGSGGYFELQWCRVVDWTPASHQMTVLWGATPVPDEKAVVVARISIHLLADDPIAFVQRISHAQELRSQATSWIRYRLSCQSMPEDGLPAVDPPVLRRIVQLGTGIPQLAPEVFPDVEEKRDRLVEELTLEWRRTHNRIILERRLKADSRLREMVQRSTALDPEQIEQGPDGAAVDVPHMSADEACATYDFDAQNARFTFATYYTQPEVVRALTGVRTECIRTVNGHMFALPKRRQMSLKEFETMQLEAMDTMSAFLTGEWREAVCRQVVSCFDGVGKGWLNVQESDQKIYELSKLRKFFVTVKYMMEDSLFAMVYKSLDEFTKFFEETTAFTVSVRDMTTVDNSWPGSDVEGAVEKQPLFTIDLVEQDGNFSYSTDAAEFENTIVRLFDRAIEVTRLVPQVEKFVLTQYFWKSDGDGPFLDTVKSNEERVCALRDRVRACVRSSLEPLREYLVTYHELLDVVRLDKHEYIKDFEEEEHTTEEMRDEIRKHAKAKRAVAQRIPYFQSVGNFMVDCHHFRMQMANKNQELARLVMDLINRMAKSRTAQIREEFHRISTTVQRKPLSVEKLYETKSFIGTLPEVVGELSLKIEDMKTYYGILESFQYGLSDDEFKLKWEAIGWPRKLDGILEQVIKQLEVEGDNFHEKMTAEMEEFTKEVDRLQRTVATFSKHTDSAQAAEVAAQVKILNKQIKEAVERSRDFNARQRLFGDPVTDYHNVIDLDKEFKPYSDLWTTTHLWLDSHRKWHNDPFEALDPEEVDQVVAQSNKTMIQLTKVFRDKAAMLRIVEEVKAGVDTFKPLVPIAAALRNPGMKERHWKALSEQLGKLDPAKFGGKDLIPGETLTSLTECYEMIPMKDQIVTSCEVAAKEYQIEKSLKEMQAKWTHKNLVIDPYKETKTYILKDTAEITELLDEHLNQTQQLQFSAFKAHFAEEIDVWERNLNLVADILEQWLECQRAWRYLEPIFASEDIAVQLPKHSKMFEKVDRTWRKIMNNAHQTPNAMQYCTTGGKILDQLVDCNRSLESVQKGLNDYLQDKRQAFPRFYFLSDEELLEILSQSKDPRAIDRHMRKLFEFIDHIKWQDGPSSIMEGWYSAEGEYIPISPEPLVPEGNVEVWLKDFEKAMKLSMHAQLTFATKAYPEARRTDWVVQWPGQIVLAASQIYWTSDCERDLAENGGVQRFSKQCNDQLMDLVDVVQGPLKATERINMGALITIEVHAKDTIEAMAKENVTDPASFDWIKQLRFYYEEDEMCHIRQVDAHFVYGGEYLGNTGRLVVTPLTDRIYLTLTGALALCLGGAPAGPAGTGKTETTKDLAKALAKQCVVFNCQEGMTFQSMGKFFKGLAWSGAWACFDEFNRIDIEVLSVVAQQVTDLQQACVTKQYHLDNFEGSEVVVDPTYAVFITMNPGYAGRTELPDNLKVLFRPVACMVPDYAMIGEIRLFSYGYKRARLLAKKMVMTFRLSSEQLSSQDHYDFGMRAVNTVISAAGLNKRKFPDADEDTLLLRALRDSNVPKFLRGDIVLFDGIISDLFPGTELPHVDYGVLMTALEQAVDEKNHQPVPAFLEKCVQLYDITILRHGLMMVGPSGAGKTTGTTALQTAMTTINTQQSKRRSTLGGIDRFPRTQKVVTHICNPKSITMDQLYGAYDRNTGEWNDGVLCVLFREAAYAEDSAKHWVLFDGPVDALWIESMNTVLDENKKLCLVSGEIIQMSRDMTMMFEVEDLSEASPATVSRCGMIYMEPATCVPTAARIETYLSLLPKYYIQHKEELRDLLTVYLDVTIDHVRRFLKEYVTTLDNNLVHSCFNMFSGYIEMFLPPPVPPGAPMMSPERAEIIAKCVRPLFFMSLIWSVGASCDDVGRVKFDQKLRELISDNGHAEGFPEELTVYDYCFNFSANPDDEVEPAWVLWEATVESFALKSRMAYGDIQVPTVDVIRSDYVIKHLMTNCHHVAAVGPTGTGKTVSIQKAIMGGLPDKFQGLIFTFSAQTSANMLQTNLMAKLDKRRSHVFGAPTGKHFICFIDDTNLPQREKYGAQPPIELARQMIGQGGFYTYVKPIKLQHLIDISFALAMGPPGGGRNSITNRFMRFFNVVSFPELSPQSMASIFTTMLRGGFTLNNAGEALMSVIEPMVQATVKIFGQCGKVFVPTPAHVHYTFNLRDVSRVFAAVYEAEVSQLPDRDALCRLWVHEMNRVFGDRLIIDDDRQTLRNFISTELSEGLEYPQGYEQLVTNPRLIYGDYMEPDSDKRLYKEIPDMEALVTRINEALDHYNDEYQPPMNLVMFLDAIEHVSRIARVLRMPNGHALLLGIGGSGRKSMTRLAAFLADRMELKTIEITKNFGMKEWHEFIGAMLFECGMHDTQSVFLFTDTQIIDPVFLEDVAALLTSGDVADVFDEKQQELIGEKFRDICQHEGLVTTKVAVHSRFIKEVRNNLHVVIAFTPIGETFRTRMRMFPALVNCCTIDWFSEWPHEALLSVAEAEVEASNTEFASEELLGNVCEIFTRIHISAASTMDKFFLETHRRAYVTPTSYLSLLQTFMRLLAEKRQNVTSQRGRLENGLEKLKVTEDRVADLEHMLKAKQPLLEEKKQSIAEMMVKLSADREAAAEKQSVARLEEAEASKKADACAAIEKQCADRLAEAEPALQEALKGMKLLKLSSIGEMGKYANPPVGVRRVCESVAMLMNFGECPREFIVGPPGQKAPDWWLVAKQKLKDPRAMLDGMMDFKKEAMTDAVVDKITHYIENVAKPDMGGEFTPAKVRDLAEPCGPFCMWVLAMRTWFYVNKEVKPLRAQLGEAQAELEVVNAALAETRAKLKMVEDAVAALEAQYEAALADQKALEDDVEATSKKLDRAGRLIDGLSGEKQRWRDLVAHYTEQGTKVVGDMLLAAGSVAYFGPLTSVYRRPLLEEWRSQLTELGIPTSELVDLFSTCGNPVDVQQWNINGLPSDPLSTENALIMFKSPRWPLLIDPQTQANTWIRRMHADDNLQVCKPSDGNYVKVIEGAIRLGFPCLLENCGESIDPSLEPVLLRQTYLIGTTPHLKVGDSVIPYDANFRFYMTTKLPNPTYSPENCVKVSLLNFFITPSGLQEQLLGKTVEKERKDLEDLKQELTRSNAEKARELKQLQDDILRLLQEAEGDILEQETLIETLEMSKRKSIEINEDMEKAKATEADIDETREKYRPHALRGSLLFFIAASIGHVDPMYQFSLQWFLTLFLNGIDQAEKVEDDLPQRIENLKEYFTYSFYANVCRSLFERHKLTFSFHMCATIIEEQHVLDHAEYRMLLAGPTGTGGDIPKPAADWLTDKTWNDLQFVAKTLPNFAGFEKAVAENIDHYQGLFDSVDAHRYSLHGDWQDRCTPLQKLVVTRCFRMDKVTHGVQDFVSHYIGEKYIIVPQFNLMDAYKDSTSCTPLIFIISPGSDPMSDLLKFAEQMRMNKKLEKVSLGQGQGPKAAELIKDGIERGTWVLLQNCHLATSWMSTLEQIVENFNPDQIKKEFRLWLTSMPSPSFPVSVLQIGVKMTNEPPKGLRANMTRSFFAFKEDDLKHPSKPDEYRKLLFSECMFHGIIQERRRFGSLGFNIAYEFNDSDRNVCVSQLRKFLDMYDIVPFDVLTFLTGHINYGGRVTDDWDRRCMMTMIKAFLSPAVLDVDYAFSPSGTYRTTEPGDRAYYLDHVATWPINPAPEAFGLHENADITSARADTEAILMTVLSLQTGGSGGGGGDAERDSLLESSAADIQEQLPPPFDLHTFTQKYPTKYDASMNTVLVQEAVRYNKLLRLMASTLKEFRRALKGEVVMSADLEAIANSMFVNIVPDGWAKVAYPSMLPLSSWVKELTRRCRFVQEWYDNGVPKAFWIGGFFFPQAFLTGTLQDYARRVKKAIDTISFGFTVLDKSPEDVEHPEQGAIVYGMFMEGARWDREEHSIVESRPKELYTEMPPILFDTIVDRKVPDKLFLCPVYKTLKRAGTLSTTGHSTNFVLSIELPTSVDADHWIKRGVACVTGLNF